MRPANSRSDSAREALPLSARHRYPLPSPPRGLRHQPRRSSAVRGCRHRFAGRGPRTPALTRELACGPANSRSGSRAVAIPSPPQPPHLAPTRHHPTRPDLARPDPALPGPARPCPARPAAHPLCNSHPHHRRVAAHVSSSTMDEFVRCRRRTHASSTNSARGWAVGVGRGRLGAVGWMRVYGVGALPRSCDQGWTRSGHVIGFLAESARSVRFTRSREHAPPRPGAATVTPQS